jgi:GNAT superfamily N-acetyltransferase
VAYTWGSLTVADAPRWAAFTKIVSDTDDLDEVYSADDLAEELEDPETDPELDTVAVDDEHGTLVAVGQVMTPRLRPDGTVRAEFGGAVHPEHRGRGIGAQLLRRQERRAVELAQARHPGVPAAHQRAMAQLADRVAGVPAGVLRGRGGTR